MKKMFKGIAALMLALTLSMGTVDAASQTKKINASACETVYTNYYFFKDANTVAYMSRGPLSTISHSTVAVYNNNYYQISNFDTANVGYGQVMVTPTSRTSADGITSMSLDDYYAIADRAYSANGAYSYGTKSYIVSHDWIFIENNGAQTYHTNGVSTQNATTAQRKAATLDADSVITMQSPINPYATQPFRLRIDRNYKGYLTGSPLMIDNVGWYFHPAVYYVQYCSPKSSPAPIPEEFYNVYYRANTTDVVTNMPSDSRHNSSDNMNISTNIPYRQGYSFLGWSTDISSPEANASFAPNSLYTDRKDLVLYAVWKKNEEQKPTTPVVPENPQTGITDYLLPFGGVAGLSGLGLTILRKKKGFKQF